MNGLAWSLVAMVHSGVFWETHKYVPNEALLGVAIFLAAFGLLGFADFLKQRTFIRAKVQGLARTVSQPIRYHYQHFTAFLQIYKMAPQILAEREMMLQLGQKVSQLDSSILRLNGTHDVVTKLNTESSPSHATEPVKMAASGVAKPVHKKIRSLNYTSDFGNESRAVFKALGLNSRIRGRKAIVITDLGEAELTKVDLQNYLDDRIDLQYWKSRTEGERFEVLTLSRAIWNDYESLVDDTIKKLSGDYDVVFLVRKNDFLDIRKSTPQPTVAG